MEVLPAINPNAVVGTVRQQASGNNARPNAPVGTQGTQGTQGTRPQQNQPASGNTQQTGQTQQQTVGRTDSTTTEPVDFRRGQEVELPVDANNPNRKQAFRIKSVVGQEVELENPRPTGNEPASVKYKKDQLTSMMSGQNG